MTTIFKHIAKMEMGYFLFKNKFYLKLTTGQENSKNSEQRKRNIDWRILSLQWFWMSNQ